MASSASGGGGGGGNAGKPSSTVSRTSVVGAHSVNDGVTSCME